MKIQKKLVFKKTLFNRMKTNFENVIKILLSYKFK